MADNDHINRDREKLSRIFDAGTSGAGSWRSGELATILEAQLAAPLVDDLAGFGGADRDEVAALAASAVPAIKTFGQLLHHPNPPVKLLVMVKDFGKACRVDPEGPLHLEVATVLYYAAIVVALKRCGARITEMNDASLSAGVAWVIKRAWVDEETRKLVDTAGEP